MVQESYDELDDQQMITEVPITIAIFTYLSFALLFIMGHIRDFLVRFRFLLTNEKEDPLSKDFKPLCMDFESFFTRNMYRRIVDCWNRPIKSYAGAMIDVVERNRKGMFGDLVETGNVIHAINMGSYNYLGFGEPTPECVDYVSQTIRDYGIATCSIQNSYGYTRIHKELEQVVADFLRKEDAICFHMGFATNSGNIQALLDDKCCIISDELNHASIVLGSRLSGSKIFVYKHNDMNHLETLLREIIVQGRGKGHRDWKKIILIVEGIYSMEGGFINLPKIIQLKKKYKFYIYLDEAHSIGCTGATGRGVTEFFGIDPKYIDIMMGTFTKSFGSCGGYIAADKKIVDHLRNRSFCTIYGAPMAPGACAQAIASIKLLTGKIGDGNGYERLNQLRENIKYFRTKLLELGFILYGNEASPVVPLLLYVPGKIGRLMLDNNVAVVVVGFPATSILTSRARFCLSSAHTREMLDRVIEIIDKVGDQTDLKYRKSIIHKFG